MKGTFQKAYKLLTEITEKVGWDMLLKYRSNNFIMEEEYRNEKETKQKAAPLDASAQEDGDQNQKSEKNEEGEGNDSESSVKANGKGKEPMVYTPNGTEVPPEIGNPEPAKSDSEDDSGEAKQIDLNEKRLCERWLDNLFMILYEVCILRPQYR